MSITEKISKDIQGFHDDIEKWFQGKSEDQEVLYRQLLSGFSPDFKMINGNNDLVTLAMLSDWLPTVYGKFQDRHVTVENIEIQHSESHGLATYTEIQVTGETPTKRKSSAVFLIGEEKALWLHLVEKWIS
ncbi:hypothetical protein MP478_08520 [Chryseobacterium sp. WG14]|uniref:hypothetical protein n=1 Tax=Chryseobacterium sp. WG14 TaxID=2926909 RepID=UPI00211EBD51|nr:hypothetical protein [Chryseobacterium sp. WG14]MCQ9639434.1 hypothetical protein [Chryseobacterium sp. WG14]